MVRCDHREIVFVLVQDSVQTAAVPPLSSLLLDFCQLLTRLTSRLRTSQVSPFFPWSEDPMVVIVGQKLHNFPSSCMDGNVFRAMTLDAGRPSDKLYHFKLGNCVH